MAGACRSFATPCSVWNASENVPLSYGREDPRNVFFQTRAALEVLELHVCLSGFGVNCTAPAVSSNIPEQIMQVHIVKLRLPRAILKTIKRVQGHPASDKNP